MQCKDDWIWLKTNSSKKSRIRSSTQHCSSLLTFFKLWSAWHHAQEVTKTVKGTVKMQTFWGHTSSSIKYSSWSISVSKFILQESTTSSSYRTLSFSIISSQSTWSSILKVKSSRSRRRREERSRSKKHRSQQTSRDPTIPRKKKTIKPMKTKTSILKSPKKPRTTRENKRKTPSTMKRWTKNQTLKKL